MVSDVLNNTMEDPTFNSKLYRAGLTPEEKQKHMDFEPLFNSRAQVCTFIIIKYCKFCERKRQTGINGNDMLRFFLDDSTWTLFWKI